MATVKTNTDVFEKAWEGFKGTDWKEKASVSRFVQANYTPYDGDESFLAGPTERSLKIKKIVDETKAGYEAEGRFPMDTRPTSIADIDAGYISKEDELIYGIQNDELFKLNIYTVKVTKANNVLKCLVLKVNFFTKTDSFFVDFFDSIPVVNFFLHQVVSTVEGKTSVNPDDTST